MQTLMRLRRAVGRTLLIGFLIITPVIVYQSPSWLRMAMGLPTDGTQLLNAAASGNVAQIRDCLSSGIFVDSADDFGTTPLHCTIMEGMSRPYRR